MEVVERTDLVWVASVSRLRVGGVERVSGREEEMAWRDS